MTAAPIDPDELATLAGRAAIAGRLIGKLAHRIRSPLAAITNSVYCLEVAGRVDEEKSRAHLTRITDQVAAIDQVLRHVTEFVERPTSGRQRFEMHAVIRDALAAPHLPRRQAPHAAMPRAPLYVVADRDQIWRAIVLLLESASRLPQESAGLDVTVAAAERYAEVSVRANGTRLTAAQAKRLLSNGYEKPEEIDDPCLALAAIYAAANSARLEVLSGEPGQVTFKLSLLQSTIPVSSPRVMG